MAYRVPDDALLVDVLERVLARHGTVDSQARLGQLVRARLRRRDEALTTSDARVRRLALERGLVRLEVATGTTDRPAPERCPVCRERLERVRNRTLDGASTVVGTRCTRCPYRSGPQREVPLRYTFHATDRAGERRGPF